MAALITRGLAEMTRLGVAMGASQATFYGLAGMGDLVLSAVDARDYPLLEALFLVLAATVLAANLLADVASTWVAPQIDRAGR